MMPRSVISPIRGCGMISGTAIHVEEEFTRRGLVHIRDAFGQHDYDQRRVPVSGKLSPRGGC